MNSNKKLNHTNHYNEIPLDEIAEITDSLHSTPSYTDIGFPMVRVMIFQTTLDTKSCLKVNKKFMKNSLKERFQLGYHIYRVDHMECIESHK